MCFACDYEFADNVTFCTFLKVTFKMTKVNQISEFFKYFLIYKNQCQHMKEQVRAALILLMFSNIVKGIALTNVHFFNSAVKQAEE